MENPTMHQISVNAVETADKAKGQIAEEEEMHELIDVMCKAAAGLYNTAAFSFTPEQIDLVRRTRDCGGALEVRIQMRPTSYVSCIVEDAEGKSTVLFDVPRIALDGSLL